jgi:hypothetical protein
MSLDQGVPSCCISIGAMKFVTHGNHRNLLRNQKPKLNDAPKG